METPGGPTLVGAAEVRRIAGRGFPIYRLATGNGTLLAEMARYSWFTIFLGRGQRILLPSGALWRLRAVSWTHAICPVMVDAEARKVAQAAPGAGNYGINGRDYAFVLYPAEGHGRNNWILRHHEDDVARMTRRPRAVEAATPVPLAAVLLGFVVMQFGIPGQEQLATPGGWATAYR